MTMAGPAIGSLNQHENIMVDVPKTPAICLASVSPTPFKWDRTYALYQNRIAPAIYGENGILQSVAKMVVVDSRDRMDAGEGKFFWQPVFGLDIAKDFLTKQNQDMGLFLCHGHVEIEYDANGDVKSVELPEPRDDEIQAALARRKLWLQTKLQEGDALWAKYGQNPLHIDDNSRRACKELGVHREWASNIREMKECPSCGEMLKGGVAVCKECGAVVDAERYAKIQFAGQDPIQAAATPEGARPEEMAAGEAGAEQEAPPALPDPGEVPESEGDQQPE